MFRILARYISFFHRHPTSRSSEAVMRVLAYLKYQIQYPYTVFAKTTRMADILGTTVPNSVFHAEQSTHLTPHEQEEETESARGDRWIPFLKSIFLSVGNAREKLRAR